jgi:hypothetical protein
MALAPEPYLSACLVVLYRAILACRANSWSKQWPAEHVAELMDAIHNIPTFLQEWEKCDVEFLRTAFLQVYESKWRDRGGLPLCQMFDEAVAESPPAT